MTVVKGRSDVRFGSKADSCNAATHVRFTPNSDQESRHPQTVMSALPSKADMCSARAHVCYGPIADIAREPTNVDGTPLYNAIGCLQHDVGVVSVWVSSKSDDFAEVWEQVRQGGYSDCFIEIAVRLVEFLGNDIGWQWDVTNYQTIQVTAIMVQFVRTPARKKLEQVKQRRGWFG